MLRFQKEGMKRLLSTLVIFVAVGLAYGQTVQDSLLQNGRSAYQSGEYSKAIAYYRQYLAIAEEKKDYHAAADAYRLIGDAFRAVGEMEEALDQLQNGLKIATDVNDSAMIGRIYNRIAAVRFETEDVAGTEAAAKSALAIASKLGDLNTVSSTLNILGAYYRNEGRPKEALVALSESVSIQRTLGDTSDIPNALNNMANTLMGMGNYEQAIDTALKSFAMAKSMNIKVYEHYAALMLYKAYRASNAYDEAFQWMETYNGLTEEMMNESKGKEISKLREEMNMAQREQENEILRNENALQQETIKSQQALTFAFVGIGIMALILLGLAIGLALVARKQKKANADLLAKNSRIRQQTREISMINTRLEQVALERELQKGRLEEINKVKDKLFSIISHDLRSPLNSIQGLLQLVQGGMLSNAEFELMADTLKTRVDNTTLLLDNLLNWSRSQMEGFSVQMEEIDVAELAAMECNLLEASAKTKGIHLENKIASRTMAYGDKNMVELVLRNLMANAIKFTEKGGLVTISAKRNVAKLHIALTDNGIGIPEASLDRVLGQDYFSTLGTDKEKGSGLGLRLCKEFLTKNGGELWLTKNEDKGMTFWVSLPLASHQISKSRVSVSDQ